MWGTIIVSVLKFVFGLIGKDYQESKASEAEMLKARAESVEKSLEEEDKAEEAARTARKKAEKPGKDHDVFGADEWNEEKEKNDAES